MTTTLTPSLSPLFSSLFLSLPFAGPEAAAALPLAAVVCTSADLCDGERCVDTCYLGLADRTCEFRLGVRALIDPPALADCQTQVSSQCQPSCEAARELGHASGLGDTRSLDGDEICIDLGLCIDLDP